VIFVGRFGERYDSPDEYIDGAFGGNILRTTAVS